MFVQVPVIKSWAKVRPFRRPTACNCARRDVEAGHLVEWWVLMWTLTACFFGRTAALGDLLWVMLVHVDHSRLMSLSWVLHTEMEFHKLTSLSLRGHIPPFNSTVLLKLMHGNWSLNQCRPESVPRCASSFYLCCPEVAFSRRAQEKGRVFRIQSCAHHGANKARGASYWLCRSGKVLHRVGPTLVTVVMNSYSPYVIG